MKNILMILFGAVYFLISIVPFITGVIYETMAQGFLGGRGSVDELYNWLKEGRND